MHRHRVAVSRRRRGAATWRRAHPLSLPATDAPRWGSSRHRGWRRVQCDGGQCDGLCSCTRCVSSVDIKLMTWTVCKDSCVDSPVLSACLSAAEMRFILKFKVAHQMFVNNSSFTSEIALYNVLIASILNKKKRIARNSALFCVGPMPFIRSRITGEGRNDFLVVLPPAHQIKHVEQQERHFVCIRCLLSITVSRKGFS